MVSEEKKTFQEISMAATTDKIMLKELQRDDSFASSSSSSSGLSKSSSTRSCCGFVCISLAVFASVFGCYLMWGTNLFTLAIYQHSVISNNSMRYEAWKTPPVQALLRIYIFNYTNVQRFEDGLDDKLILEELGPYTYLEKLERVDVRFNKNGTLTYRDKKTYKFSPEHSKGNESDIIYVPNLPFLAAVSFVQDLNPIIRWSVWTALKSMSGEIFIPLKVGEFLWGYEDRLSILAQKLLSYKYNLTFQKFGILSAKNQTQNDFVTIYTGEENPSKTGIVMSYNGKTSIEHWNSMECNRIDGTDGTIYPAPLVRPNSTLYIYSKDFCRKLPLTYKRQYLDKHGIPVLRFNLPKNVFASGQDHKDNLCFCSQDRNDMKCLPSGVFNVAPCAYKAPLVTSLPHFLYGDPILSKGLQGLKPVPKKHESFVEVDRVLGLPVGGKSRLQLNIIVGKNYGSYQKNRIYKNQFAFPITWMDYGVDRLPGEISSMICNLLYIIEITEFVLSYGFIVSSVIFSILLLKGCGRVVKKRHYEGNFAGEAPLVVVHEKR